MTTLSRILLVFFPLIVMALVVGVYLVVPRLRGRWRQHLSHLVLLSLVVMTLYPFVQMLILAGKNWPQFEHRPWPLTFPYHWVNFSYAWDALGYPMFNSILIVGVSTALILLLAALSAFVFARFNFYAKEFVFYAILSLMMVPGVLSLIPQFILVKNLGLMGSRWALILPYVAAGQVLGIFLLRSFFNSIPKDLFEAAEIDGASDWQTFFYVALPLCRPILATLAIMNVINFWNDYIWPLAVYSSDPSETTLAAGLIFFRNEFYNNWGPLFAGYTLSSIPLLILFALASRQFISGLTSGAVKI